MAAAPDDDARRTLAELEAKLRELERELLRGYEGETVEADPFAAPADETDEAVAEAPAPAPPDPAAPPEVAAPAAPDFSADGTGTEEPGIEEELAAPPEPADGEPPTPTPMHPEEPPAFDPGEWATPEAELERLPAEPEAAPEPAEPLAAEPEPEPQHDEPEPQHEEESLHAAEPEPEPEPDPEPRLDPDALAHAHDLLANLRETIEDMGLTAQRVTAEAQAVADDHGRALGRLARVAQAAARAEEAAFEAGRIAATVVVEAGPFADADAVTALRDTLAAQPGARDAYVRGVEDGRAVIEVHLAPPTA